MNVPISHCTFHHKSQPLTPSNLMPVVLHSGYTLSYTQNTCISCKWGGLDTKKGVKLSVCVIQLSRITQSMNECSAFNIVIAMFLCRPCFFGIGYGSRFCVHIIDQIYCHKMREVCQALYL